MIFSFFKVLLHGVLFLAGVCNFMDCVLLYDCSFSIIKLIVSIFLTIRYGYKFLIIDFLAEILWLNAKWVEKPLEFVCETVYAPYLRRLIKKISQFDKVLRNLTIQIHFEPSMEINGAAWREKGKPHIQITMGTLFLSSYEDIAFTIAHELGHIHYHDVYSNDIVDNHMCEFRADAYAIKMLKSLGYKKSITNSLLRDPDISLFDGNCFTHPSSFERTKRMRKLWDK